MAIQPSTTRRALFAAALALPLAVAASPPHHVDVQWAALSLNAGLFHKDGPALVAKARREGFDIEHYAGMGKGARIENARQFWLMFGNGADQPFRYISTGRLA